MSRRLASVLTLTVLAGLSVAGQGLDEGMAARIRREANTHSEVMKTLHFLTDVYGPRLTGSPNLTAAATWALERLSGWGLSNAQMHAWDFARPGWSNQRFVAHIVSPVKDALVGEPLAWTPGTKGVVQAEAMLLDVPPSLSAADLSAFFAARKRQVSGKIVLVGASVAAPVPIAPPTVRCADAELADQYGADARDQAPNPRGCREPAAGMVSTIELELDRQIDEFLTANGALVRVNDARRPNGQVEPYLNRTYEASRAVPTVVLRNEDYGRIARILADRTPVRLEFDVANTFHADGRTAYNATADLAGTDKRDELIMLGAHLDSWHAATGATDNAAGCAVMMEAMRILAALKVQPRRTIRLALWSGEEQGLLGSQAYVASQFGTFERPTAQFGKLSAYLNLDNGTGRIRGAQLFAPPGAVLVVRETMLKFSDLGVAGAAGTTRRVMGDTDSSVFNHAGLPGLNFIQDPIEYDTHTHHTNLDTYERVIEADVRASAIVVAALAYDLAMRDELLPRFGTADMPPVQ